MARARSLKETQRERSRGQFTRATRLAFYTPPLQALTNDVADPRREYVQRNFVFGRECKKLVRSGPEHDVGRAHEVGKELLLHTGLDHHVVCTSPPLNHRSGLDVVRHRIVNLDRVILCRSRARREGRRVGVRACVRACACVCVRACVRERQKGLAACIVLRSGCLPQSPSTWT
jgi:hypothetical protein